MKNPPLRSEIAVLLSAEAGEDLHSLNDIDRKYYFSLADVVIDLVASHIRKNGDVTGADLLDAETELSRLKDN